MNDVPEQVTEPVEKIEPVTSSADGSRNSFTHSCAPTGQSMSYAACLWRLKLAEDGTKMPADWMRCVDAKNAGRCQAVAMREEELLAGKSIYFRERGLIEKAVHAARQWVMPVFGQKTTEKRAAPAPAPARKPVKSSTSMLDAMGDAGSLADAVTAAASTRTDTPLEAVASQPVRPMAVALPGETPLQMARRLRLERQASAEQA